MIVHDGSQMSNTTGHTMHRYQGHKLHLASLAQRKATALADNGLQLDVAPFWTACPPRGCDCAECALDESYSDSWAIYPMTRYEMTVADYFAELDSWRHEEDWYRLCAQDDDQDTARRQAEADQLVIAAYLAGAAV